MKFQSDQERNEIIARSTLLTMPFLLLSNIAYLVIGYIITDGDKITSAPVSVFMRNVLFFVVLCELIATFIVKKKMLAELKNEAEFTPAAYTQIKNTAITIAAMCGAIGIYGLVAILLGNKFEVLVFFVAVSLIAFQIFRLRSRDFEVEINKGI
jgi:hypothetical protein